MFRKDSSKFLEKYVTASKLLHLETLILQKIRKEYHISDFYILMVHNTLGFWKMSKKNVVGFLAAFALPWAIVRRSLSHSVGQSRFSSATFQINTNPILVVWTGSIVTRKVRRVTRIVKIVTRMVWTVTKIGIKIVWMETRMVRKVTRRVRRVTRWVKIVS